VTNEIEINKSCRICEYFYAPPTGYYRYYCIEKNKQFQTEFNRCESYKPITRHKWICRNCLSIFYNYKTDIGIFKNQCEKCGSCGIIDYGVVDNE